MNDLRDLDWQASTASLHGGRGTPTNANYNPIYRGQNNPFSQGSATPRTADSTQGQPGSSPAKVDSFGGLVNFGRKTETLSLAQQAGEPSRPSSAL